MMNTMTQAHPEGPHNMQKMHRNQEGTKSIQKNYEKWIEDTALHNPLPYNLQQGESRFNQQKSASYGRKQVSPERLPDNKKGQYGASPTTEMQVGLDVYTYSQEIDVFS